MPSAIRLFVHPAAPAFSRSERMAKVPSRSRSPETNAMPRRTAARFLLQLWYYGEHADTAKLERVVDCLLKALSAERDMP